MGNHRYPPTTFVADDGAIIDTNQHAVVPAYNADGTINYFQVVKLGVTYRQTYTWTDGKITNISIFTAQP